MIVDDALGDRMKMYESAESGRRFMPLLPILARIDGRRFSAFTRGFQRPYDQRMAQAMIATTGKLVEETNACMGYTQSDEITLTWHSLDIKSQVWFDGRVQKMVSQLAAQAMLHFFCTIPEEWQHRMPTFDARAWQVPNRTEGANVFLWREWDATKNSLTMAASEHYSHNELHGKNGADKHEMLHAKGINWNDYPAAFKRGTFVQRRTVVKPFTAEELERLPAKHQARANPDLMVERQEIAVLGMPPFAGVSNREAVIFEGASPVSADR